MSQNPSTAAWLHNMLPKPYLALVAEDSEADEILIHHVMSLVHSVKLVGFVRDGVEVLSYLRGTERFGDRKKFPWPDLLFLDYQMPRLDGMEVLAALQSEGIRLPIIFWSTSVGFVDQELAKDLGATLVCQKPMSRLELLAVINQLDRTTPAAIQRPVPFPYAVHPFLRAC